MLGCVGLRCVCASAYACAVVCGMSDVACHFVKAGRRRHVIWCWKGVGEQKKKYKIKKKKCLRKEASASADALLFFFYIFFFVSYFSAFQNEQQTKKKNAARDTKLLLALSLCMCSPVFSSTQEHITSFLYYGL